MRKLIFTTAFLTITFFVYLIAAIVSLSLYHSHAANSYLAKKNKAVAYAALPSMQNTFLTEIIETDGRAEAIRQFFAGYSSPLEPYADDIVKAADEYGLDYKLLPAIAMQESNLCKKAPDNSFNCWGFGIYGGRVTRFKNYTEAIYKITKTLATKYKEKGLITPQQIETMYTPPSEGSWAFSVDHFMNKLE